MRSNADLKKIQELKELENELTDYAETINIVIAKLIDYLHARVRFSGGLYLSTDQSFKEGIKDSAFRFPKTVDAASSYSLTTLADKIGRKSVKGTSGFRDGKLTINRANNVFQLLMISKIHLNSNEHKDSPVRALKTLVALRDDIEKAIVKNDELTIDSAGSHHLHISGARIPFFGSGTLFQSQADHALMESFAIVNKQIRHNIDVLQARRLQAEKTHTVLPLLEEVRKREENYFNFECEMRKLLGMEIPKPPRHLEEETAYMPLKP